MTPVGVTLCTGTLGLLKKGFSCLVKDCNKLFSIYRTLTKHLKEHFNNKDYLDLTKKSLLYEDKILVHSSFTKKDIINYFIIKWKKNNASNSIDMLDEHLII